MLAMIVSLKLWLIIENWDTEIGLDDMYTSLGIVTKRNL